MKLTTYILAMMLTLSVFSCKDDEVDCSGNEDKIDAAFEAYDDALTDSDCDAMATQYNKIISLAKKSKSCGFIKDAISDGGYDSFDEMLADFAASYASDRTDAGC